MLIQTDLSVFVDHKYLKFSWIFSQFFFLFSIGKGEENYIW